MPPNINSPAFRCPKPDCGRRLKLKYASSGVHAKCYYLDCHNASHPDSKSMWYFFPRGVAPDRRPASSPPAPLPYTGQQSLRPTCTFKGCLKMKIARICSNRMCKAHCETTGGCLLHPVPLPSQTLPPLSGPSLSAFEALRPFADPFPRYAQAARLSEPQIPSSSPSPTLSQLESDRQYALLLSFDDEDGAVSPSAPSTSSRDSSSTSRLPHIQDDNQSTVLFFWSTDGAPVSIQLVEDCPSWPRLCLRDIAHLLTTPAHPHLDDFYQCYSFSYHAWMRVSNKYPHALTHDQPILVRRLGVIGSDENDQLRRLGVNQSFLTPLPVHSTAAAASTSTNHKGKRRHISVDSSDDEVLVVSYTRAIKKEAVTPPREVKRSRLALSISIPDSSSLPSLSSAATSAPTSASLPSPLSPSWDFPLYLTLPKERM
ncbi:hypothetical protein FB451DRAFT_1213727 [Mycena latifolia]|nr:hypothetical protein FB451DRAFT_1213727 [Mycena latifolia]